MSNKRCPFCGRPAVSIRDAWEGSSIVSTLKDEIGCDYCNIWMDEKDWNTRYCHTCEVIGFSDTWIACVWELSCGHRIEWDSDNPPKYCPECGTKVV